MNNAVATAIDTAKYTSADGWPTPDMGIVKGYRLPAPPFPLEIFGTFWSNFIRESAESKSCPPDYVAAGLMVSASALLGNAYRVSPWDGWSEPSIIWGCCVGNPSSGKTPGLEVGADLIRDLENEINEDYEERKLDYETRKEVAQAKRKQWKESLQAQLEGNNPSSMPEDAVEPEKPYRRRLMIADATVEIIAPIIANNPKGVANVRDELAGWLGAMNQYKGGGGADRPFWLEAYNGKNFTVDRAKAGLGGSVTVPHLSIPIIGGIQPDRLAKALLKDADDGLTARFLYFWPDPVPPQQPKMRPNIEVAKAALRKLRTLKMVACQDGHDKPYICLLEPAAVKALNEYRSAVHHEEASVSGLYLSYLGKNSGRALRLALIIELMIWSAEGGETPPDRVSEKSLLAALSLLSQYFSPMAMRAFDTAALPEKLRNAAAIGKFLQREKWDSVSTREISRKRIGGLCKAEVIEEAIDELVEAGWLRPDPSNLLTGGRPKKKYWVNPLIREDQD